MAPSCEKGHEPSRYIKQGGFVTNMINAILLKIAELP
jgi:hypothetical protein